MEEAGGSANAMTYYDFTAYIDDVPPGELGAGHALEADRMVNLALTKRQVDNRARRRGRGAALLVEDSVDGMLDELMYMQSFRKHPYR